MSTVDGRALKQSDGSPAKIMFLVTEDWYFLTHRVPIAKAAQVAGAQVLVACSPGSRVEEIKALGFEHVPVHFRRRSLNPFVEAICFRSVLAALRAHRPDILHCVALKPIVQGGCAARLLRRRPALVYAVTGLGYAFSREGLRAFFLRCVVLALLRLSILRKRSRVIFQNPDDQLYLRSRHIVMPDTHVIYGSGVDPDEFPATSQPGGRPRVLLASRMLWHKGVGDAIEAVKLLKKRGLDFELVIAGASDEESRAAIPVRQLQTWNDSGLATWVGGKRRSEMPALFASVNFVILPSYYREGVPLVLLEAAAAGRPIVTTDMPGCREICQDGQNGILVPIRDPEHLASAIELLLMSAETRARMGAAGRLLVLEKFTKEIVNRQILDLYRALLAS
jgi:glycosyltransferase involved in cell wall biosynthesis